MPYRLKKKGAQICIVKSDTGDEVHCHGTRSQAVAQMRALYANSKPSEKAVDALKEFYRDEGLSMDELVKEFPLDVEKSFKDKMLSKLRELLDMVMAPEDDDEDETEDDEKSLLFSVYKENDLWRWQGCYSNIHPDRSQPTDQIEANAHQTFAFIFKEGLINPPLLPWHVDGLSPAITERVWFDEATGEAWASGTFLKGFESQAEWLSQQTNLKMSHRMPIALLNREPMDLTQPGIIKAYVSTEFTYLPSWAAANEGTKFGVSKEDVMKELSTEKKDFLKQQGFTDEQINLALTLNKEVEEPVLEKEEVKVEEVVEEKAVETEATQALLKDLPEIIDAVRAMPDVLKSLSDQIKAIADNMVTQSAVIAALQKSDEAKVKDRLEGTPIASRSSLKDLLTASIGGTDVAKIDGRTMLAKDAPQQNDTNGDLWNTLMPGGTGDWRKTIPAK